MLIDSILPQIIPLVQMAPAPTHDHGHPMFYPLAGLPMLLLGVIIVIGCIFAMRSFSSRRNRRESPMDILKRRYAKGEIDRETFEQMRKDMEDGP